jgi:hypothetical protein
LKTLFAYLLGAILIAPLAMLLATPIGFLMALRRTLFWPGASGFVGALLAYYAVNVTFQLLDASFHWYSYLLCMFPIFVNEGKRTQRETGNTFGTEKASAAGVFFGFIFSLLTHFQ